ncbi:MAG TPA: lipoyl synthase [Acidimicrobiales bacterium]|nr:lipoyl synthase [Acidimicrobiales bacterium]
MRRARWLGRVRYRDAHALQRALWQSGTDDWLLLLEHPHVYTLGVRADLRHVLVPPADVGAELVRADRGGDVTYHGPGQLVGYPVVGVPPGPGSTPNHVRAVEQLVIDALADLGLPGARRSEGYPGVWVNGRKVCAVGVRISRGRSMHGFALNVHPDMAMFGHIVPCGIADREATSLHAEGLDVTMQQVVDAVVRCWGADDRQEVAWHREDALVVDPLPVAARKPEWARVHATMGPEYRDLKKRMRRLDLVTVCEEAGCPNIFECWADGTATFMINGERCTRACGFCLVDTRKPGPLDAGEPDRVAQAVADMHLSHAVVTAVARDDLPDGGAAAFAATIEAIRRRCPGTAVEVLIPDCKGDPEALATIFDARPDVLNHNLETVARLQRVVRPSASYARSLAVLARSKQAGLVTKSGIILGMGETEDEVLGALADLRGVGVDIVTLGQYLRPTADHLPVARWWTPEEFDRLRDAGVRMGFAHVEASPLTRSSYHAKQAAALAIS